MENSTFVSYSRRDKEFVQRLVQSFNAIDRDVWVDWEDIPPTAEWLDEIYAGIENADHFLFVISPDSARSEICAQEIEHALQCNKRLIPILYRMVDSKDLHSALSAHNWIYFDKEEMFNDSFNKLIKALETDLEYTRMHTRLLTRAIEWQNRDRDDNLLLRGIDLSDYQNWLAQSGSKNPRPTDLQTEYIFASHTVSTKRQRNAIRFLTLGLIVALLLMLFALISRREAEDARNVAQKQTQENRSLLLADRAISLWNNFDYDLSAVLVLEANNITNPPAPAQLILNQLTFSPGFREIIQPHQASINDVTVSADGEQLLVASFDGTITLWDMRTHELIRRFEVPERMPVMTVTFSPVQGSPTIIAGLLDGTLSFWDTNTGEITRRIGGIRTSDDTQGHQQVITSLDTAPRQNYFVSGSSDERLILWDIVSISETAQYLDYGGNILTLAMSQDGHYVAIGGESSVVIWDTISRDEVLRLPGNQTDVLSVAFSPNGALLASSYRDNTVIIWSAITGREVRRLNQRGLQTVAGVIRGVGFTPDNERLITVSEDGSLVIWNFMAGFQAYHLKKPGVEMMSFAMTPDGRQVVTGTSAGQLIFWNTSNEAVLRHYRGHEDGVNIAVFSPDGKWIVTASDDAKITLWDAQNSTRIKTFTGHNKRVKTVAFSPDGRWLASAGEDGTVILWDMQTYEEEKRFPPQGSSINTVIFSSDGQEIIAGLENGQIAIWQTADAGERARFADGHTRRILTLAVSHDSNTLVSGAADRLVIVWDLKTGSKLHTLKEHTTRVLSVAYSTDGEKIFSTGLDGQILIWNVSTGRLLSRLKDRDAAIWDIAVSPNWDYLATGDADGILTLWDLNLGQPVRRFEEHKGAVLSVQFSPNGNTVLTGSRDKTAILWDMPDLSTLIETLKERSAGGVISCTAKEVFQLENWTCSDEQTPN